MSNRICRIIMQPQRKHRARDDAILHLLFQNQQKITHHSNTSRRKQYDKEGN